MQMFGKSKVLFLALVFFLLPFSTALGADGLRDCYADYDFAMEELGEIFLNDGFPYAVDTFDDPDFYLSATDAGNGIIRYVPQVDNGALQTRIHCRVGARTHELHIKNLNRDQVDFFLDTTKEMGDEYHPAIGVFFSPDPATRAEDYVFRRISEEYDTWFLETRFTVAREESGGYRVKISLHKKIRENVVTVFSDPGARWTAGDRKEFGMDYFSARAELQGRSDDEESIFGVHRLDIFKDGKGVFLYLKTAPGYWNPEAESGLGAAKIKAVKGIEISGRETNLLEEIQAGNLTAQIRGYVFLCALKTSHLKQLQEGKDIRFRIGATNGEEYEVAFPLSGSSDAIAQVLGSAQPTVAKPQARPTLLAAMDKKDYSAMAELVQSGVDVNAPIYKGLPPLAIAVRLKDAKMIRILGKAKNLDTEWKFPDGDGYLHVAAHYYRGTEVLKALLDVGCWWGIKDKTGRAPLSRAVCYTGFGKLDLLLKAGAGINVADDDGNTALHHTAANQYTDTQELKYLVDRGAGVDMVNELGDTPFMVAVKNQCWSHVKYLIQVADVTIENRRGRNAYAVAKAFRDSPDLTREIPMLALADDATRQRMKESYANLMKALEPSEYYYIGFREYRNQDPRVRIKYKDDEGRWVEKGWFGFNGHETMLLAKTKHPVFYYYADYDGTFVGVKNPTGLEVMETGYDNRGGVKVSLGTEYKGKEFFKKL